MYSPFQLAKKYISFYVKASNSKGHGIHSPFVYNFIKFVLNNKKQHPSYKYIEQLRTSLLKNNATILVEDFGAGSTTIKTKSRVVKKIASSSLKPKKYGQLFHRMLAHYNLKNVLELGTSLGVTTAYLATASNMPNVTTMEGSKNIAAIANQNFKTLHVEHVTLLEGDFDKTLPAFLEQIGLIDFAFIDGNHRELPTVNYFEQLLKKINENSVLVFDDIHWSKQMENAWELIKNHKKVTLTIDLFFIGIVFFKNDFKVKQHFSLRF